ncbi:MAG TPA: benzoyl-CoA-dihydrodiol lyase [Deltaproteobacteria bacterium]|nr:benzoyl-CoA-dihydrodiol lyase [Deltaproteobacteria bacterium]
MASDTRPQRLESFHAHPDTYRHWKLQIEGRIATLLLDVQEDRGLRPDDYVLKQNSYDLGVDIELADAIQRLRFEHPEVRVVVFTSAQPKVFCAGANIRMLATSTHAFKVNFCRYTNETRCSLEDASIHSDLKSLAALNGTAAGGGYELALACDEIYLIEDGSSAVSLPEVPLLGVLPGTGGLTRLVDKRRVRGDIADVFCTKAEGFRAKESLKLGLIDGSFPRSRWSEGVDARAAALAEGGADGLVGIELSEVTSEVSPDGCVRSYRHVQLRLDAEHRLAYVTIHAPDQPAPASTDALQQEGSSTWSLAAFRELDDALVHLRFNHPTVGTILIQTRGDAARILEHDALILEHQDHWLAREIRLLQARVFRRLDNTARSMFAIIDEGSCFAGSLFELTLAADRSYMLEDEDAAVTVQITGASGGAYPMSTGLSRLAARFLHDPDQVATALAQTEPIDAPRALELGLVTFAPDDIDWEDEIRIAIEERASLSPDALTGMEQNLRFVGAETCDSKIFGRLSAWQNWIFQRPNAVGDEGALTLYGHPTRPSFDWKRT